MIKQVFILAAGEGKRMRPLTDNIPKPLVKVAGISMLDRILKKINKIKSVEKIVINGYYLAEKVEYHVRKLKDKRIKFSREFSKLETGGALINALPFFDENEPILIINGDIVWQDQDVLEKFIANFDEKKMDLFLGLKEKDQFLGYDGTGDFTLDKETKKLVKNVVNELVYVGIQIFHPRILKDKKLPSVPFSLNYFFNNAEELKIKMNAMILKGKIFHIGTTQALSKCDVIIDKWILDNIN